MDNLKAFDFKTKPLCFINIAIQKDILKLKRHHYHSTKTIFHNTLESKIDNGNCL